MTVVDFGRRFPKPLRTLAKRIYEKWNSRITLDEEMVNHLGEYFDLTREEIICMLKVSKRVNADVWRILNPEAEEEILQFYKVTPYEIFDTAYWHMSKYQRKLRSEIVKMSYGKVLDYGGGIGDLSVMLAQKGCNVTYVEVPGETFEFAKWLFNKKSFDINVLNINDELEIYDTIICINVIEHVTDPKALLKRLAISLNKGGQLILMGQDTPESDESPMHFSIDFNLWEELKSYGLFMAKNHFSLIRRENLWRKQ